MKAKFDTMPRYLTIKQLAQLLGISFATAYRRVSTGDIPSYRIGKLIRIKSEELEKYLKKQRIDIG